MNLSPSQTEIVESSLVAYNNYMDRHKGIKIDVDSFCAGYFEGIQYGLNTAKALMLASTSNSVLSDIMDSQK